MPAQIILGEHIPLASYGRSVKQPCWRATGLWLLAARVRLAGLFCCILSGYRINGVMAVQRVWRVLCSVLLALHVPICAGSVLAHAEEPAGRVDVATWLEVTPPPGWERAAPQETGGTCVAYGTVESGDATAHVGMLACAVTERDAGCEQLMNDAAAGTAHRVGRAVYENRSETAQLICAPTRDEQGEVLFAVMADDLFSKHKARAMLAAFTQVDMPPEDLAPEPLLHSYLPQRLVGDRAGHEASPLWGGIQYDYRNAEKTTWEAKAVLMSWYAHWATIPQYLRSLAEIIGPLEPDGASWARGSNGTSPVYALSLSRDKRVLLLIRCADEATAATYKAAFDQFVW